MSDVSQFLGLDKDPQLLAELNDLGHQLGTEVVSYEVGNLTGRLYGGIDSTVAKFVDATPIPHEVAGVTKLFLAAELKMGVSKVLNDFTPTPNGQGQSVGAAALGNGGTPLGNGGSIQEVSAEKLPAEEVSAEEVAAEKAPTLTPSASDTLESADEPGSGPKLAESTADSIFGR